MTQLKSKDPTDWMGVYKRLEDMPADRRLSQYEDWYENRDVWGEWADIATDQHQSDRYAQYTDRTERSWRAHMEAQDRHHALARPDDIDSWCEKILNRCVPVSAYQIYFTRIEPFYTWLQQHRDHPHCYHPVWMAAANGDATATIWKAKMEGRGR
ncbi:hypothetical protein DP107_07510 [Haloglomus irregulare]|jgi:hypothetical protein|uniref:Uncharacterized protein n=1 Tax=Haloglomus irregulare TaxID=2234134 RepID=A0A554NBQ1_9EURY|nr:hypothetical protein [Haloglomus irregulare]TSD14803.1 hypothetical protein DP107_07510 [Haloglomus irregulare]